MINVLAGPMSSMEQHLPMRMSMLGNGPPPGNAIGHVSDLQHSMDEFPSTAAVTVTGSSDGFMSPSQLLSTGSHAGVEEEARNRLPQLHGKDRFDLDPQLSGRSTFAK